MTESYVPEKLRPYLLHEFSSGCTPGEDYKKFEREYAAYLRRELNKAGFKVEVNKNHYCFSAVATKPANVGVPEKYVYISISDVRSFKNGWANSVLVRTMAHKEDWTGGDNTYCTVDQIANRVKELAG